MSVTKTNHNRSALSLVAASWPLIVVSVSLLCGCPLSTDIGGPCGSPRDYNSGNDPCAGENGGGQFYYTSGVAVDPGPEIPAAVPTNRLYVSNANADLRYSGGTVMAVDTGFFECALLWARAGYTKNSGENVDEINACLATYPNNVYPNLMAIHDASQNSFGEVGGCRVDLSDPSIIECDEDIFITSSVRVGNFAGSVRIQTTAITLPLDPGGTCPANSSPTTVVVTPDDAGATDGGIVEPACTKVNERLWVPVRGDPSITFVNVVNGGNVVNDGGVESKPSTFSLSCIDPAPLGTFITQPGYVDASGNPITRHIADSCVSQRITTRDFHSPDAPGFYCNDNNMSACVNLPAEPFGIYLDQGVNGTAPYAHLLVTSQSTGEITYINAAAFDPRSTEDHLPTINQVVYDVRAPGFSTDGSGRRGSFGIAPQQPGVFNSWWYVTSRLFAQVAMFRLADANVILNGPIITLSNGAFSATAGNDNRDIVFDPACASLDPTAPPVPGCRAFVVENNPPSVYTLDTRVDPSSIPPASLPRNEVVDIVAICQGPSHLYYHHSLTPGAEGMTSLDRIYVNCFTSGQVLVVDPDLAMIVDNVLVGRGPNEMAFNFGFDEVRQRMLPEPAHRRAYVTDFLDSNIAVLDLDPGSPTEDHVIGRIGLTDPPRVADP